MNYQAKPAGPTWRNRFWPGLTSTPDSLFDRIGAPLLVRPRHLPTGNTVEAVLKAHPESGDLMRAWSELWKGVEIDELAAETGLSALDPESANIAAHARNLARMLPGAKIQDAAAMHVSQIRREARRKPPSRDGIAHALEDATVQTLFSSHGVPFAVWIDDGIDDAIAFAPRDGTLRRIAEDDEAHDHIQAVAARFYAADDPYWTSDAFREASGRATAVTLSHDHLVMTLLDMAAQGHRKAFLKTVSFKRGTWVIDIGGIRDADTMALQLHRTVGSNYAALYSPTKASRAMVVQEFLPFTHEHRFFVVAGRIVASTASDRSLTVLDAGPRIVDERVAVLSTPADEAGRYDRGEARSPVDRVLAAEMARKALALVRALDREAMVGDCYVLDMGLTERGVRPIEINTIMLSGLYAAPYARVARAFANLLAGKTGDPDRLDKTWPRDHLDEDAYSSDLVQDVVSYMLTLKKVKVSASDPAAGSADPSDAPKKKALPPGWKAFKLGRSSDGPTWGVASAPNQDKKS